eukprot:11709036-Prorocentrum_lima.AAC.1
MTSSLVGSEMCIRDRQRADLTEKSAAVPGRQATTTENVCAMPTKENRRSCLLYTSDAADDM